MSAKKSVTSTASSSESLDVEPEEEPESDDYKVSMEPNVLLEPLCLPVDRAFESKYLYRYLAKNIAGRKPTPQEKIYMFLEHPSGWMGFLYHMMV